MPFCGVLAKYAKSMVLLEEIVRQEYPDFDAAYFPQNVSTGRHACLEVRLERIRQSIGADAYDHLLNNNRYDIELYERADELLEAKFQAIADHDAKLADLEARCLRLR